MTLNFLFVEMKMIEVLNYFKVMVTDSAELSTNTETLNTEFLGNGIVLDFNPSNEQQNVIKSFIKDSNFNALFSTNEVESLTFDEKIMKQMMHYIVSFETDYKFDIQMNDEKSSTVPLTLIRGVSKIHLNNLVTRILYANRPIKDSKILHKIITENNLSFDFSKILNNEMKILLFDELKHSFDNGDDVVRYIITKCSDSELLIKSKEVLDKVELGASNISFKFLDNHKIQISNVFNRHKKIIMSLKTGNRSLRSVVNQITRMSKKTHIPIYSNVSSTFVNDAMITSNYDFDLLKRVSVRNKFKILNILDFKLTQSKTDIFTIRNGKTFYRQDRKILDLNRVNLLIRKVVLSLNDDLSYLKSKTIVLPKNIDYGLPMSRKQSIGHLPFGSKVTVDSEKISSGVFWKNEWGARDIDLSTVDRDGNRIGWGNRSGYDRATDVDYSGDVTNASNGAMEFMTSKTSAYGLFANIYAGEMNSEIKVVVGEKSGDKWMDNPVIREKMTLKSRGNVVGFVNDKTFTVFYGRIGNSYASGPANSIMIHKGLSMNWTVKRLFDELNIKYIETAIDKSKIIDYDLSYDSFTFDKLENLFNI